jgi:type IV pilus assembly protein PilE
MNAGLSSKRERGFTLIEVMIVLVLIAIVAAIALPNYSNQVTRGRRSDCQGMMMAFNQAMERYFAINFTYLGAASGGGDTGAPEGTLYLDQCPQTGAATYNLTIAAATANSFTLRATPVNGRPQAGDGILEVNSLGQRFWDKNNDGDTADAGENNWELY